MSIIEMTDPISEINKKIDIIVVSMILGSPQFIESRPWLTLCPSFFNPFFAGYMDKTIIKCLRDWEIEDRGKLWDQEMNSDCHEIDSTVYGCGKIPFEISDKEAEEFVVYAIGDWK